MKEQRMAKKKTDTADHKRCGSNSIHLQDGGVCVCGIMQHVQESTLHRGLQVFEEL
jgi:ribosomal protein L37E